MNKKRNINIFSLILISIFTIKFTSADFIQELTGGFEGVYRILEGLTTNFLAPFVRFVLTNSKESLSGEMVFAKLLFFFIIFAMVYFSLGKTNIFQRQKKLEIITGIIVSILATRWLGSEALIQTMILPYSVLGITISAGLPFIIYFLFIEIGFKNTQNQDYSILRKFAWSLFIAIFIGLWISRYSLITQAGSYAGYIYPGIILLSFLVLLFDPKIQQAWLNSEINRTFNSMASKTIREMKRELFKLYEDLKIPGLGHLDLMRTREQIEKIQKQIAELMKGKR
jgi:hypothetical protein